MFRWWFNNNSYKIQCLFTDVINFWSTELVRFLISGGWILPANVMIAFHSSSFEEDCCSEAHACRLIMLYRFSIGLKSGKDAGHSIREPFLNPNFIKYSPVFLVTCYGAWISSSFLMQEAYVRTMAQSCFLENQYKLLRSALHLQGLAKVQPANYQ